MAGVAQLVRAPDCGPGGRKFDSCHPPHFVNILMGCSQEVKAPDFDSGIRWFKSSHPSHGPLAQMVEHLTFNQGVPGSIPGWTTKGSAAHMRRNTVSNSACLGSFTQVNSPSAMLVFLVLLASLRQKTGAGLTPTTPPFMHL